MAAASVRWIDWAIVVVYLVAIAGAGLIFMGRNKSASAYFKGGGALPWWVASFSLFMALCSPLSFLSVPALVYSTDMSYLPIFFGAAIAVPIAAKWFLPFFHDLNLTSAYEYLEVRFNLTCRLFASAAFILFMISLTAVVAYLPAVALAAVTGMNVNLAVTVVMVASIIYCATGGITALAWVDVVQSVLLFVSIVVILSVLLCGTDGGIVGCIAKGIEGGKFNAFDFSLTWSRPLFWVVLIGGTVAQFISCSSDQRVVQRYMTVKDVPAAKKSMNMLLVATFVSSTLVFLLGLALWTYYSSKGAFPPISKNDQILPVFIANELPVGVAGVALAAIAATTVSTLSANLNSTAAAFTADFYRRLVMKGIKDERRELVCGKVCTVVAGLLGGSFALVLVNSDIASAYEQFQRYIGILTAGLSSLFVMGIFMKRVNGFGAVCGLVANYVVTFGLDLAPWPGKPHLLLYGAFGLVVSLVVATLTSPLRCGRMRTMKKSARLVLAGGTLLSLSILNAAFGDIPRVWTSASGMKDFATFEKSVVDCRAHGVDVMECHARSVKLCAECLAVCRKHGMKLQIDVSDASKADWQAKKTGRYELAVMSGGCYKGLAIDRNLFSFSAAKHEIVVEPPVYSKGQAYAKHPHYYMLGDGHYFGGYVPTGRAEVVVPERLFDGKQHLRIIPAKVEAAPSGVVPENDSAADILDTNEIRNRRLVKLSFDLTGCEGCRLDKVGIAVYWHMDDKDPKWRPERTCYSVFSPITRERMRESVRSTLSAWTEANGGKFPSDVVVGLRLGDEIFNATGWVNCPAASFPLWDYSASAIAAFRAASPRGVEPPRTWGAPEVYGADACAQSLYLFHKACADYIKVAVDEAHRASPALITFRNTTRGDAWSYGNDHDGTGQELLAKVLDAVHLDPYPVAKSGYADGSIPFDMAYLSGFARRFGKPLLPWMQAHEFLSQLVHPTPEDIGRMWSQMKQFAPDAIMWLGYNPSSKGCTFPLVNPASWEKAKEVHADLKAMPKPTRSRPPLAIVRPYSARALVCETGKGFVHPADVVLRQFARAWSCDLGRQYDVFEVPPYATEEAKAKLDAELKQYAHVVSSVDWPGAVNVARDCADKVLSAADLWRMRGEFRKMGEKM